MSEPVYRPHDEPMPTYEEERGRVDEIFRRCQLYLDEGDTSFERAFCQAWLADRGSPRYVRLLTGIGATRFLELFQQALREAQWSLEEIIAEHLAEHREAIDPIDAVSNANHPKFLMDLWFRAEHGDIRAPPECPISSVAPFAYRWVDRRSNTTFEIARKMAIASQYLILEALDPLARVESDLATFSRLADERLFSPGEIMRVCVTAYFEEDGYTYRFIELGDTSHDPVRAAMPRMVRNYEVRTVRDGETIYLVQTTTRPKLPSATILKLARNRKPHDRRGARHVLLAIFLNGSWQRAKEEHLDHYVDVVRRRMIVGDLEEVGVPNPPNPDSSALFRTKRVIHARWKRPSVAGTGFVRVSFEFQVITLELDFADANPIHPNNHKKYRGGQIKPLRKAWFPHLNGNSAH